MEFRILGQFEVAHEGRVLDLGGGRQRALLAILVLHAGEVMSVDRLIDELWPASPPPTAAKIVQVYVSQLRKALGRGGVIVTQANGYALDVHDATIDLRSFEALEAEARHAEPAAAGVKLREALALWRGTPLADFAYESFAQREISRLEELRLVVVEARIEADLALGSASELVPELEALVAEHPLRERVRGQLMLALYRSGRQAEALETYREARRLLDDQLGLDPGDALQRLEQAILRHDPELEGPVQPRASPRRAVSAPVRYVRSGDVEVAYQVTGGGLLDLVLVPGFVSHLELDWAYPGAARLFERLGSFARLIRFDPPGIGLSRAPPGAVLESRPEDVCAVMDAAGSASCALLGYSEGGYLAIRIAAEHPQRVSALVLLGAAARRVQPEDDAPDEAPPERIARAERIGRSWGAGEDLDAVAPGADDELRRWYAARARVASSPGSARARLLATGRDDVRVDLDRVDAPTLVLHRRGDRIVRVEEGRYLADHIPGARFVELEGSAHLPYVDSDSVADEVEAFLTGVPSRRPSPALHEPGAPGGGA